MLTSGLWLIKRIYASFILSPELSKGIFIFAYLPASIISFSKGDIHIYPKLNAGEADLNVSFLEIL